MVVSVDLPPELEREIFITVARQYRWFAPTIILLCRKTQTWIEPILYESVVLSSAKRLSRFRACLDQRPPEFFAKHVKRLCLPRIVPAIEASYIISRCSGVIDLACWFVGYRHAYLSSRIITLPLRHLSVDFDTYLGIACQVYTDYDTDPEYVGTNVNITHLTLLNFIPTREHPTIPHLHCFSALTHLRLAFHPKHKYFAAITAVLKGNTNLSRVVLMHAGIPPVDLEPFVQESGVDGSKCQVVSQDLAALDLTQEWEDSWDAVINAESNSANDLILNL
ncbi:hypothetical protein BDN72DRAFT_958464 [Pluteus cervinus]|uniref:Uncharacterized protein n=1 Tax=Pluteus cervinus TaxID=181527 RepID=A0ACD3AYZ8_9AGAR|nr:hypothetical protein BDN72DRAFT_958464 [Pluteus cervinus]